MLYKSTCTKHLKQSDSQSQETEKWFPGAGKRKNGGLVFIKWSFSLEDEKFLKMDGGDGCMTM